MFQRTREPAFAIAFVSSWLWFLQASQIHSKFLDIEFGLRKIFPKNSFQVWKLSGWEVKLSFRAELSYWVVEKNCLVEFSEQMFVKSKFRAEKLSRRKVKTVKPEILLCQNEVSVRWIFKEQKMCQFTDCLWFAERHKLAANGWGYDK